MISFKQHMQEEVEEKLQDMMEAKDDFVELLAISMVDTIPRTAAVNPRVVKKEKIIKMLRKLKIKDNQSFITVLGKDRPDRKLTKMYVDTEIFGLSLKDALRFAQMSR